MNHFIINIADAFLNFNVAYQVLTVLICSYDSQYSLQMLQRHAKAAHTQVCSA